MRLRSGRCVAVLLGFVAANTGCGPSEATIELEILDVQPAAPGLAAGDIVPLQVQVRNNGRDPGTVCAAVAAGPESGLIRKGPPVEIRRGRTETLSLDVPAARPYLRGCNLATLVFLARPGEPGNLARDMWLDGVPNHSREINIPLTRPVPATLELVEPIQEVVEPSPQNTFRRHYEATAHVLPEGSRWAIRHLVLQSQTALGRPVEVLTADLTGEHLRTGSVIWDDAVRERDSVARATVRAEAVNCAGETIYLLAERIAVRLAPR